MFKESQGFGVWGVRVRGSGGVRRTGEGEGVDEMGNRTAGFGGSSGEGAEGFR